MAQNKYPTPEGPGWILRDMTQMESNEDGDL
jgi:hypothetical protein